MQMIYPAFFEVQRNSSNCNNNGRLIPLSEIISVNDNDTKTIRVTVRKYSRHGIETESFTLSEEGTQQFRQLTNTQQTNPKVLEKEHAERGWEPRYDE